ncbi:DUF2304 domain-containing protein [Cryobacterium psychrophilum]|uniref:DUF2304 domain-containing protein n=1 Tax=Cryobacterium psychrophilum TaxID=41988 RepID=A0A4Y8KMG9_9MICO|nr:DUF2304 domain-containing protein [Cryobacterium psychrophilum]TDW30697.1 hypothetical protein EDD25_2467 [Cryobacterium psychrophilum]TFD76619.1 DUF2304 domain-containing protein [Cryobacterium psychrophilum]
MNVASYVFGIVAAVLALTVIVEMLRRRRLRERHAVWWILAGVFALVVGIFPQTLVWASTLVGVEIPTNLVFFLSLLILFLVCIQHSGELTDLEDKTRVLAENSALQHARIDEMERALIEIRHTD